MKNMDKNTNVFINEIIGYKMISVLVLVKMYIALNIVI